MPGGLNDDIFDDEASRSSEELGPNTYVVEKILKKKFENGRFKYYVKWAGYPSSQNEWVDEDNMHCDRLLEQFNEAWKKQKQIMNRGSDSDDDFIATSDDEDDSSSESREGGETSERRRHKTKKKKSKQKESDDEMDGFIVSDESEGSCEASASDESDTTESDENEEEWRESTHSKPKRKLTRRIIEAHPKTANLTIRMKPASIKQRHYEPESRDLPGPSRLATTKKHVPTKGHYARAGRGSTTSSRVTLNKVMNRKRSAHVGSSEESDSSHDSKKRRETPRKKKLVISESDDDEDSDIESPASKGGRRRAVISEDDEDAHDVGAASERMGGLSVARTPSPEAVPSPVQQPEPLTLAPTQSDKSDATEALDYSAVIDADDGNDNEQEQRSASGEVRASATQHDEAQPAEIHYFELEQDEPNGFDRGWTVQAVHDIIRGPGGGRCCIVEFAEQPYSQLIEAEVVCEKAPKLMAKMLHKKINLRV